MKNASKNDSSKKNAGYKAAEYVEDGMVLGLGTGSTTHYFIEKVGMRMAEEGIKTTPNKLIHVGCPIPFDTDKFLCQLQTLMEAAYDGKDDQIRELVADTVETYRQVLM